MPPRSKKAVVTLSVISNTSLVIGKAIIGLLSGSVSIISEAAHSAMDLLAALIAFFAVHTASKPADEEHRFGHGKIENISGVIEALLIFVAAAWIISEAIHKLSAPRPLESLGLGMAVMLASSAVNWYVATMLFETGKREESPAIIADAWHLMTDVYTSLGVAGGLAVIYLGGKLFPNVNLLWLDPVCAIAVALLIIKAAWHLVIESGRDLLDESLPAEEQKKIAAALAALAPELRSFRNMRTRKAGAVRFVEIDAVVDSAMSVEDSHKLSDRIEAAVKGLFQQAVVTVHMEPCEKDCPKDCAPACTHLPSAGA